MLHLLATQHPEQSGQGAPESRFYHPSALSHQAVCSTKSHLPHSCSISVKVHALCYIYRDILTFGLLPIATGVSVAGHITY